MIICAYKIYIVYTKKKIKLGFAVSTIPSKHCQTSAQLWTKTGIAWLSSNHGVFKIACGHNRATWQKSLLSPPMAQMEGGSLQYFKQSFPGFPVSSCTFLPGEEEESLRKRWRMNNCCIKTNSHICHSHTWQLQPLHLCHNFCLYWKWVDISWKTNRPGAVAT